MTVTNLRTGAERLRSQLSPGAGKPPEENGVRLATIKRGSDEELRLSWAEYNNRHFVNIRIWQRLDEGWWSPKKDTGLTVRLHELAAFADGIAEIGRAHV